MTRMTRITRFIPGLIWLTMLTVSAQGPLTPPGSPAPTMKTLDQIESRTPVQSLAAAAPYSITQPGSYYLTGNITVGSGNAVVINSDDVSLDLNGFTIRSNFIGGGHNGAAITATVDHARLSVRNGSIVSGTSVPASASLATPASAVVYVRPDLPSMPPTPSAAPQAVAPSALR